MPTVRGRADVSRYIAGVPGQMKPVLRGAGRAAAKVVADEIKQTTPSEEVREAVRIRSEADDQRVRVTIDVKPGWARSVGTWLEYGTSPHFISVDDSQRGGVSVGRINQRVKEHGGHHSLVIGGNFVGTTVLHPGARPHPTFRPALDRKEAEAIAAAQGYINARVSRAGIAKVDDGDDQ
jgi:hypothetical protein